MSLNKKITEIFRQLEYPTCSNESTIGLIGNFGYKHLSMCFLLEEFFNFEFKA